MIHRFQDVQSSLDCLLARAFAGRGTVDGIRRQLQDEEQRCLGEFAATADPLFRGYYYGLATAYAHVSAMLTELVGEPLNSEF